MTGRGNHRTLEYWYPFPPVRRLCTASVLASPWLRVATAVVGGALAVLFVIGGQLNDGGWYLYAAKLACTGHLPYRDFLYPQPPLTLYLYGPLQALTGGSVLLGRLTALTVSLVVVSLCLGMAKQKGGPVAVGFVALCFALNGYTLYYLTIVKTYPLAALFLFLGAWACLDRKYSLAQGLFVLATLTRLSAAPALVAAWALEAYHPSRRTAAGLRLLAALTTLGAVGCGLYLLSGGRLWEQLFLPLGTFIPGLTRYYVGGHENYSMARLLLKKAASVARTVLVYYLPCLALGGAMRGAGKARVWPRETLVLLVVALPVAAAQLLARRPYEEYQTIVFPLLCVAAALLVARCDGSAQLDDWVRTRPRWATLLLATPVLVAPIRGLHRLDWSGGRPALAELHEAAVVVQQYAPHGEWLLTLEPYLAVESKRRELPPELLLGKYAYHPDWSTSHCRRLPVVNKEELFRLLKKGPKVVALAPNHFLTADPAHPARMKTDYHAFVSAVRDHYDVVDRFPRFGYSRDTLTIYAHFPGRHGDALLARGNTFSSPGVEPAPPSG